MSGEKLNTLDTLIQKLIGLKYTANCGIKGAIAYNRGIDDCILNIGKLGAQSEIRYADEGLLEVIRAAANYAGASLTHRMAEKAAIAAFHYLRTPVREADSPLPRVESAYHMDLKRDLTFMKKGGALPVGYFQRCIDYMETLLTLIESQKP